MTPAEFARLVAGFEWRQERQDERMAHIVAAIYNTVPSGKRRRKPVTADDILVKRRRRRAAKRTPEAQRDALIALTRRMGGTVKGAASPL